MLRTALRALACRLPLQPAHTVLHALPGVSARPWLAAGPRIARLTTAPQPRNAFALYQKGLDLVAVQDNEAARECFEDATAEVPGLSPAHIELGLLAARAGDFTVAFRHLTLGHATFDEFMKAPGLQPVEGKAPVNFALKGAAMHVGLAEVYRRHGDTLKQRQHLELALGLSPHNKAVRLALADLHLRGKVYGAAIAQLEAVLAKEAGCKVTRTLLKNVYLGQAMDAVAQSDPYTAIRAYEKALETEAGPGDAQTTEIHFGLGALYESVGNTSGALKAYREAAGRDSGHWRSRVALGALCHKLGAAGANVMLLDEAVKTYNEALLLEGCKDKDKVNYGLGVLYVMRQEAERATEKFRAALEVNPRMKEARLELATLLLSEGNPGGAVYHLEEALKIDPHYGAARHNLRQVNARLAAEKAAGTEKGDGVGSDGQFDMKKFDAPTRDALMAVGEAEVAGRRGDLSTAIAAYDKYLPVLERVADKYPMLQEGLGAAYWNQGLMMQRLGDQRGGHSKLELAYDRLLTLGRSPRTPGLASHVFSTLVSSFVNQGDLPGAQRVCEDAASAPMLADSATPTFLLGTLCIFTGQLDAALDHFKHSLEIDPYHAPSHFNSGNVYLRKNSETGDASLLDAAITHCRDAIRVDDKSAHAHLFLGEALLRQGKEAEGLAAVQQSLKIAPDFAGAHSVLGAYMANKGRAAEAVEHLSVAIAAPDAMPEVRERDLTVYVVALMRLGRSEEALTHCKALVSMRPDAQQYRAMLAQLQSVCGVHEG